MRAGAERHSGIDADQDIFRVRAACYRRGFRPGRRDDEPANFYGLPMLLPLRQPIFIGNLARRKFD